jgi:hypothetical protein
MEFSITAQLRIVKIKHNMSVKYRSQATARRARDGNIPRKRLKRGRRAAKWRPL